MTKAIQLPVSLKRWAVPLCALGALVLAGCAPETEGRRAGDVFQDRFTDGSGQGPEMVVLPSGSFTMGSPLSEAGRFEVEGPQRTVRIGHRLAIGRYEVTFAEWDACVADGGCNGHRPDDFGWGRGNRPVINVSWNDAQAYLTWLNFKTGITEGRYRYRLPSEAEWEYAARAGTTTPYSFGVDASQGCDHMNGADDTYGRSYPGRSTMTCDDGYVFTAPVGSFLANPYGLSDMHGNVSEWVEDCWNPSHVGAPTDGSARKTGDCSHPVIRGGDFASDSQRLLRSASRYIVYRESHSNFELGFRLARTLPD